MNLIKGIFKFYNDKPLVKVYSHPRSGTHFMEAFLAKNFYPKKDLSIAPITWGHWSDRRIKEDGNPYGKLFGNHYFGHRNDNDLMKIYMLRDGRAVAYSIWKTPNFIHPDLTNLSFSEFLRVKIDWLGTPSKKVVPKQTILEHWVDHVNSWKVLERKNTNTLIINYEDLIDRPYEVYLKIYNRFFSNQTKLAPDELDAVKKPLGLLPNQGKKDSWLDMVSETDEIYMSSVLNMNKLEDN